MTDNQDIHYVSFDRFELELPNQAVDDCSHAGQCDADVDAWQSRINRPDKCTPEALRKELSEYGAWEEEELSDDAANWRRIVWLAASNAKEDRFMRKLHS